jgi:flagellar biosynthesis protein FliR
VIADTDNIALALGFARMAAFAAAMPLGRARSVPQVARVALALALTPLAAAAERSDAASLHSSGALAVALMIAPLQGAAFGLCATIAAGAAAAAGSLIDGSLAMQPATARDVFDDSGPVGLLCANVFGWLFMCGPFARLAALCMSAGHLSVSTGMVGALAGACVQTALGAAGPAVAAQAFAAIVAGGVSRIAPRVNGMFLSAPLCAALVLLMLAAAGGSLLVAIAAAAWRAAQAPAAWLR